MKVLVILGTFLIIFLGYGFFWQAKQETPFVAPKTENKVITNSQIPVKTPPVFSEPTELIDISVPFTVQAPFAQWKDKRQQDACEEAAALMAVYWAENKTLNPTLARDEILNISQFEEDNFGTSVDTSAQETVQRIFQGYFNFQNVSVKEVATSSAIISELEKGHVVIVPANGRLLNNPHFTSPGPERHNLLIRGFDPLTQEFIANDAGIKEGEKYRYPREVVFAAIRDYPTGDHVPIAEIKKVMIVVSKE